MPNDKSNKIIVFQNKKIRRIWYQNQWYFSVIDIVFALTESENPRNYWNMIKNRELKTSGIELYTKCVRLKLRSADGKMRKTDCANTESLLRLIQSIPSKKAEPFKRWLAKVGYERIQEIENPELAQKRIKEYYRTKGYSDKWIEKRMRGIVVRDELTEEWDKRGARVGRDYSILTSEISKATFGLTPTEYKELESLNRENLRDHMDDMELILTMFGEAATTRLHQDRDSQGFRKLRKDAMVGGNVAGIARNSFEEQLGKSIITDENYLSESEISKRKKQLNR
jgi:DNA-damage-inducible protein D